MSMDKLINALYDRLSQVLTDDELIILGAVFAMALPTVILPTIKKMFKLLAEILIVFKIIKRL